MATTELIHSGEGGELAPRRVGERMTALERAADAVAEWAENRAECPDCGIDYGEHEDGCMFGALAVELDRSLRAPAPFLSPVVEASIGPEVDHG